jgi:hypothetical protein
MIEAELEQPKFHVGRVSFITQCSCPLRLHANGPGADEVALLLLLLLLLLMSLRAADSARSRIRCPAPLRREEHVCAGASYAFTCRKARLK